MTHLELMREFEQMEQAIERDSRRECRALRAIWERLDRMINRMMAVVNREREGAEQ